MKKKRQNLQFSIVVQRVSSVCARHCQLYQVISAKADYYINTCPKTNNYVSQFCFPEATGTQFS